MLQSPVNSEFNWVRHAKARPTDFYQTNFNDKGWDDLQVPGVWELNGYDNPIYVGTFSECPYPIYHKQLIINTHYQHNQFI